MVQKSDVSAVPSALLDENRRFYDQLWGGARLVEPERFNTWPIVQALLPASGLQLEVAPGLRPRLPIQGTQFVDISSPALNRLHDRGAMTVMSEVTSLPYGDACFDFVCALDIIEHVDEEDDALTELARVTKSGGALLISTPLHPELWTPFDDFVGHKRRYEPDRLLAKLAEHHLEIQQSAIFGMQPRSSRLVDLGMWWLLNHRERAMWWYNRAIMPIALVFQKKLQFSPGMITTEGVDEILLVCRRKPRSASD